MSTNTDSRSRRPMSGPGYDFPVPINRLQQGERFVQYNEMGGVWGLPDTIAFGTVLWIGTGSVELWWDHESKPTRCQPEMSVWKLDEETLSDDEIEAEWAKYIQLQETNPSMATDTGNAANPSQPVNPTIKALIARLNFQYKSLADALEGDDKAKASICMTRLQNAIVEARRLHLAIPAPPESIASYDPLKELLDEDKAARAQEQTDKDAQKARQADTSERTTNRAVAMERHTTEVKTAKAKGTSTAKPKSDKTLRPCLEGCGAMVAGNFAMGHDAKLKSLLIKVERGEKPLEDIPEIVLDLVKIVKDELIQERDSQGNAKGEPKQTYRITAAPVKFPGRPEIALTKRDD